MLKNKENEIKKCNCPPPFETAGSVSCAGTPGWPGTAEGEAKCNKLKQDYERQQNYYTNLIYK